MAMPFSIVDCRAPDDPARAEATAVVLLRSAEDGSWMQGLAAFLGLPVTAFVWPAAGGFRVRLFAPGAELEFSGPGLASAAHAIWHAELLAPAQAVPVLTGRAALEARRTTGGGIELVRAGTAVFGSARVRTAARGEISWPT
jgi:predicted PhzF superfamily epimerase YddE/YHI9